MGDGSFWFIALKVIAMSGVKEYSRERVTISVKTDLLV